MMKHFFAAALLVIASSISALSHGDHGKGRLSSWYLQGGRQVSGTFHSFRGDWVVVEGRHGKRTAVPIDEFSPADQDIFNKRRAAIASLNAPPPSMPSAAPAESGRFVPRGAHSMEWGAVAAFVFLAVWFARRRTRIYRTLAISSLCLAAALGMSQLSTANLMEIFGPTAPESIDSTFAAYKPLVKTRWDATYFYVESNGMPSEMPAMKGITAWQQQVPIPQPYSGNNAWSIPLNPVIAEVPVSLDTALHTGAVAIAVNGVPVFNPENNRGEFSQDIGELDAFGGHCGRADDYHYHIAPVHLAANRDPQLPIAWALDGYPLYGFNEPDGSKATGLDQHLGHLWNGQYHYHAIDKKPYMIASMRGKVTVQNDQVMPQPRASGVRPFLQALRGATITDLRKCDSNHYALRYEVGGKTNFVNYRWDSTGKNFVFNFVKTDSGRITANYSRK